MQRACVGGAPEGGGAAWFRSMAAYPLLQRAEEIALATAIRRGLGATERLAPGNGAAPGAAAELREAERLGAAAMERLVCCNLRLVAKIAMDHRGCGMPLEDMIAEGAIGARAAAERFDPGRGVKFSTYASFWIRQRIRRALCDQGRTVRLPVHASEQWLKLRRAARALWADLGREPTDEEVLAEAGISPKIGRRLSMATGPMVSLSAPLRPGEGAESGTYGDLLADAAAEDPAARADSNSLVARVGEVLGRLPAREREIIRARFGLDDGGEPRTLDEIGESFGLSRERIRQIEAVALEKLHHLLQGKAPPRLRRGQRRKSSSAGAVARRSTSWRSRAQGAPAGGGRPPAPAGPARNGAAAGVRRPRRPAGIGSVAARLRRGSPALTGWMEMNLTARQRDIVVLLLGLDGRPPRPPERVGRIYRMSAARVESTSRDLLRRIARAPRQQARRMTVVPR